MSKDLSAEYYQGNKERLQRKACERYNKSFSRRKRKKSHNMVINDTRIYQKMKNKCWLGIEKNITK